jgi:hypothetical protein
MITEPIDEFLDRPEIKLLFKLNSVFHVVTRSIQIYCHYETLVRQDLFLNHLPDDTGARVALASIRRAITSELSIILTALWEKPRGEQDYLDKESFPALLSFAKTPEVVAAIANSDLFDGRLASPEVAWHKAYKLERRIENSLKFKNQKNLRDRAQAHRLRQTNHERRGDVFESPTHGDLQLLFVLSLWCYRFLHGFLSSEEANVPMKQILENQRLNTRAMWMGFNSSIDTFSEPFGH